MNLISLRFPLPKLKVELKLNYYRDTVETLGVQDWTDDGKRIVFLDYDGDLRLEHLEIEIKRLQEEFLLGDFLIMETSQYHYHAICFDKVTTKQLEMIIGKSNCHETYKINYLWDFTPRVLRIEKKGGKPKPKFIKIVKSFHDSGRDKSYGHIRLYERWFQLKGLPEVKRDGGVHLIKYTTQE